MLANADAVNAGPVQDSRIDLSRLTDEQFRQPEEVMTIAGMALCDQPKLTHYRNYRVLEGLLLRG
jgi:hypothetical protein